MEQHNKTVYKMLTFADVVGESKKSTIQIGLQFLIIYTEY